MLRSNVCLLETAVLFEIHLYLYFIIDHLYLQTTSRNFQIINNITNTIKSKSLLSIVKILILSIVAGLKENVLYLVPKIYYMS